MKGEILCRNSERQGGQTRRYKKYEENKPDTLEFQLNALKDTGFNEVDCFYKYGVFAIYGGRKQHSL